MNLRPPGYEPGELTELLHPASRLAMVSALGGGRESALSITTAITCGPSTPPGGVRQPDGSTDSRLGAAANGEGTDALVPSPR